VPASPKIGGNLRLENVVDDKYARPLPLYVIELEPEVWAWLELLPARQYRKVEE
jgi:hypothetical protein